jgi:PAS domain S-box-containing protein
MQALTLEIGQVVASSSRTECIFQKQVEANYKRTDRMFAWLAMLQWFAAVVAALWISPKAWEGQYSFTHIHVWAAIFLGGLISGFPLFLALTNAGSALTRHVIAGGQMLSCGLLIHLTGGRVETHFQYFVVLAFLAFYRDWRVLLTASAVAAADHFIRGYWYPQSLFGVLFVSPWRSLEHTAWIVFEDIILVLLIRQNLSEMLGVSEGQAKLEQVNEIIERTVRERTSELRSEIEVRERAEGLLRLLSSAVEQAKESIVITDAELNLPGPKIIFTNPAFTKLTGYAAEEAVGKTPRILQGPHTDKSVLSRLRQSLERGEPFEGEVVNYRKDGTEFYLEWQIAGLRDANKKITHFVAIQRDITERKQIEARLFQSQKMETVGKLAGGIAHEFNSILTAIIGQSEFLIGDLPPKSALGESALEIRQAAERAASLTQQLLAYGRKQILQPAILDLNLVLSGMVSTLQHLIGREIDMRIVSGMDLKAVKIDPAQLEQVIVNLTMNAAEAMPNGGKLVLETANVTLDEAFVIPFPGLKPGGYVMLAITDTGIGMSEEVKGRAFEPFFSTKSVGQGTGLGLATCYGIVKQSGGHMNLYSEVARGTTFKIYLPEVEPQTRVPAPRLKSAELPRGTETILLAEDDPSLLKMSSTLLIRLGYTVLTAANGVEALSLKNQRNIGHIDLLLTDVVMPHMSGKELSDRIKAIYPQTKILFTSAYTENSIVHQGILDEGVTLLQKPFTPSALANKVRDVLDQPFFSK